MTAHDSDAAWLAVLDSLGSLRVRGAAIDPRAADLAHVVGVALAGAGLPAPTTAWAFASDGVSLQWEVPAGRDRVEAYTCQPDALGCWWLLPSGVRMRVPWAVFWVAVVACLGDSQESDKIPGS